MGRILKWIAGVAGVVAGLGSVACVFGFIDEPTMPKSMIK